MFTKPGRLKLFTALAAVMLCSVSTGALAVDIDWMSRSEISALKEQSKTLLDSHEMVIIDAFEVQGSELTGIVVSGHGNSIQGVPSGTLAWLSADRKNMFLGICLGQTRIAGSADVTAQAVEQVVEEQTSRGFILSDPFMVVRTIINNHSNANNTKDKQQEPAGDDNANITKAAEGVDLENAGEGQIEITASDKALAETNKQLTKGIATDSGLSNEELQEIWQVKDARDLWFKWRILFSTNAIEYPQVDGEDYSRSIMIYYSPGCFACNDLIGYLGDDSVKELLQEERRQVYLWPVGHTEQAVNTAGLSIQRREPVEEDVHQEKADPTSITRVAENFVIMQQIVPEPMVPYVFWADNERNLQHQAGGWETKEEFVTWLKGLSAAE